MRRLVVISMLVLTVITVGCESSKPPVSTQGVDESVREVLDAVAADQAAAAYETHFTPEFKSRFSSEAWQNRAEQYRKQLGAVQSMTRQQAFDPYVDDEGIVSVTAIYRVVWAKGSGAVTASLLKEQDWKISSLEYQMESQGSDTAEDNGPRMVETP
jgi:hypothetical protein